MQKPRRRSEATTITTTKTTTTAKQQQQQLQLSTRLIAIVRPNCQKQHQKQYTTYTTKCNNIQYATTCQEGQVSFRRRGETHNNALLSSSTITTTKAAKGTIGSVGGLITKLVSLSLDRWFLRGKSHRKEFWRIPDRLSCVREWG